MLYEQEELDKIFKNKESNDKIEEFFNTSREKWKLEIHALSDMVKCDYISENVRKIVDVQLSSLAYRQNLNEEIAFYLQKRSKEKIKLKRATQEKIVWYAVGNSPLGLNKKLSTSQMTNIIDGHTAEIERGVEIIEVHIDFLRTCTKILTDLGYSIKNNIDLHTYLSKN